MSDKPNVIFYAPFDQSNLQSAAAARLCNILKVAQQKGHYFEVWCHGQSPKKNFKSQFNHNFRPLAVGLPSNKSSFVCRFITEFFIGLLISFRIFKKKLLKSNFKVLFSSPPYVSCLMGALICRLLKVPYYLDVRDLYPEAYFFHGLIKQESLLGQLQKQLSKFFYSGSECVFTVTQGLLNEIKKNNEGVNCHLIRNGFDQDIFKPVDILEPKKSKTINLIFHGNLGHMQNIDGLLKLAELIAQRRSDIRIKIIGDGPQEYKVINFIKNNKAGAIIDFYGAQDSLTIAKLIAESHIGLSFRNDGFMGESAFPVKVYEYIGVGRPVIITPLSEAGECVESLGIGFQFSNDDWEKVYSRIDKIIKDDHLWFKFKENSAKNRNKLTRNLMSLKILDYLF